LQERIFNTESFRVASRHFNLVAFAVDVGLLLKVLKSAVTNAPDTLDVKLTQCAVAVPGCEEVENKPFLCFTARVSIAATAAAWAGRSRHGKSGVLAGGCLPGTLVMCGLVVVIYLPAVLPLLAGCGVCLQPASETLLHQHDWQLQHQVPVPRTFL
jgi:hypothetical protein